MAQATARATAQATPTKLRPLHDRVLVKRLEEQDERHGRILIPDTAKEKPQEGQVIAVGTGKVTDDGRHLPLAVKQGDRILFGKYSGSEVKLDGEEFLIMKEEDVLGILGGRHA
jgi:chaperonin GroES